MSAKEEALVNKVVPSARKGLERYSKKALIRLTKLYITRGVHGNG
jgi:hypothetical protein